MKAHMLNRIRFSLDISSEDYLRYYQGSAHSVVVTSEDGRRIQFPASNLRPFVTREGVRGRFELLLDEGNRLLELRKL
jgi:hypothetical protein